MVEGKCPAVLLSEPEESDSLCLLEDGGCGRRRGTRRAGLDSARASWLMEEVRLEASSRSRESSCTTTSATSAVSFSTCGSSSSNDPSLNKTGGEGSLPSFGSSSSRSFSSIFISSSPSKLPSSFPSSSSPSCPSLSSESPKPSCARALAIFRR